MLCLGRERAVVCLGEFHAGVDTLPGEDEANLLENGVTHLGRKGRVLNLAHNFRDNEAVFGDGRCFRIGGAGQEFIGQLLDGRAEGGVHDHIDGQGGELAVDERPHHIPGKPAVAAAEGRHGQRGDAHLLVVVGKVVQAVLDVRKARSLPPMALGGEIEDGDAEHVAVGIGLARHDRALPAPLGVVAEHVGEMAFELERQALAHHPHAVDGVGDGLHPAFQDVACARGNHAKKREGLRKTGRGKPTACSCLWASALHT